jgi:hypothetical protein
VSRSSKAAVDWDGDSMFVGRTDGTAIDGAPVGRLLGVGAQAARTTATEHVATSRRLISATDVGVPWDVTEVQSASVNVT